jgi:hypothetical protein
MMNHPIDEKTRRDVRFLKMYAVGSTLAFTVLAVSAFRQAPEPTKFEEISVERINVIEKDGTPRLILSNKARFPGLIIKRKEYPHPRNQAGMLFFSDEGTENGGLGTSVTTDAQGYRASGQIMFDQYNQDQSVGLSYQDANGRRSAALRVWDRGNIPIEEFYQMVQRVRAMPDGPEKTREMEKLSVGTATRLVAGRLPDSTSAVVLSDAEGKPRLRLVVEAQGTARIEFLDATGKVVKTL